MAVLRPAAKHLRQPDMDELLVLLLPIFPAH
jgi:hypothetical protein